MSLGEVERFVSDVRENEELLKELSEGVIGLDELVARARERGYDFSAAEAKTFASNISETELTDAELDQAAGGTTIVVSNVESTVVTLAVALIVTFVTGSEEEISK